MKKLNNIKEYDIILVMEQILTHVKSFLLYNNYTFLLNDNYEVLPFYKNLDSNKIVKIFGYIYIIKLVLYIFRNSKRKLWISVKKIPYISNKIIYKRKEIIFKIKEDFQKELNDLSIYNQLPKLGLKKNEIEDNFKQMVVKRSIEYSKGRVSGSTYSKNEDLDDMLGSLFKYFNKSNPLHTNLYPAVRKMENECISMMIKIFNGDENVCGVFTSGGTESILMACKTYRDLGRANGIVNPEIVVSDTVHCSFNKACKYFNIKLVSIPCLYDGKFDLKNLEKKINRNTILIVGSTPSYNLGIIDQVPKLSEIALRKNVPLHLDACIGSFLINFSELRYDFSYPGVCSISADFHKYGQTPKGASSILYRNKDILKYQYYIDTNWSGGVYATSTFSGSRCGNVVALAWATLMYYGEEGYRKNYEHIIELNEYLVSEIENIKELFIYGDPKLSIIGVGSKLININTLSEKLKELKWDITVIQNPNGFHFCITSYHTKEILGEFIKNMKDIIDTNPLYISDYSPCIYGTMKKVKDTDIIEDVVTDYLHCVNNVSNLYE